MPKPPPRSSSGSSTPCSRAMSACRPQHPARRDLEAAGVEDLRADVAVQPETSSSGRGERAPHRLLGRAAGEREPELLVLVGRRDVLVRVRLDADRHAQQHGRADAGLARRGRRRRSTSSRESTTIRPDAGGERPAQLGVRLVVAVQPDPLRRDPGPQRDGELPAGAHVEAQARRRRPSARPRCTGTPCPRSRRRPRCEGPSNASRRRP